MVNLIREIFFNCMLRTYCLFTRRPILSQYYKLLRTSGLSSDEINEFSKEKLSKLLSYAYENSEYYSVLFDKNKIDVSGNPLETLKNIPPLDKYSIRKNFDKLISKKYKKNNLVFFSTSGTTGTPTKFVKSKKSYSIELAALMRNHKWLGMNPGGRHMIIWGNSYDVKKSEQFFSRIKNWFWGRRYIPAYELSDENMDKYIRQINKFRPVILEGYSNALYLLAEYIKNNNLTVFSPKSILSTAGKLLPYERVMIEEVFKTKIYERYGSREICVIATECSHHEGMHINEDLVIVEILDPKTLKPVKDGETGEIYITDLNNYAMPLIRYKIGDMGAFSRKKCTCGINFKLLEKVEGRITDMLYSKTNRASGLLIGCYLKEFLKIKNFQIIQKDISTIQIDMVVTEPLDAEEKKKIIKNIESSLGKMNVIFNYKKKIELKNGKLVKVVNMIKDEDINN